MNVAKVAIVIILLILMIVVFFALTGLNVRNPLPAVERIIAWLGRVNRSINTYLQGVFYRIRNNIRSRFGNPPTP